MLSKFEVNFFSVSSSVCEMVGKLTAEKCLYTINNENQYQSAFLCSLTALAPFPLTELDSVDSVEYTGEQRKSSSDRLAPFSSDKIFFSYNLFNNPLK